MNHSRTFQAPDGGDSEWLNDAACRSMNPNVFLPAKGDTDGAARAVAICHTCPVQGPCLERALRLGDKASGIWAGTSERARERLRQRRRADIS